MWQFDVVRGQGGLPCEFLPNSWNRTFVASSKVRLWSWYISGRQMFTHSHCYCFLPVLAGCWVLYYCQAIMCTTLTWEGLAESVRPLFSLILAGSPVLFLIFLFFFYIYINVKSRFILSGCYFQSQTLNTTDVALVLRFITYWTHLHFQPFCSELWDKTVGSTTCRAHPPFIWRENPLSPPPTTTPPPLCSYEPPMLITLLWWQSADHAQSASMCFCAKEVDGEQGFHTVTCVCVVSVAPPICLFRGTPYGMKEGGPLHVLGFTR